MKVYVSVDAVADFNREWPCSEVPEVGIMFEFASNGDLVDIITDDGSDSAEFDGPALLALSMDAQSGKIGVIQ